MTDWSLYKGQETNAQTPDGLAVEVKAVREDCPRFRRIYRARLNQEISISVTMSSWISSMSNSRSASGELKQRDGKWVMFDPERIAEKIIDDRLVPLVEDYCRKIARLDREYMGADPKEFVDERGRRWVRAERGE